MLLLSLSLCGPVPMIHKLVQIPVVGNVHVRENRAFLVVLEQLPLIPTPVHHWHNTFCSPYDLKSQQNAHLWLWPGSKPWTPANIDWGHSVCLNWIFPAVWQIGSTVTYAIDLWWDKPTSHCSVAAEGSPERNMLNCLHKPRPFTNLLPLAFFFHF